MSSGYLQPAAPAFVPTTLNALAMPSSSTAAGQAQWPKFVPNEQPAAPNYMDALAFNFQGLHMQPPATIAMSGHTVDVREFSQQDRLILAQGAWISIFVGDTFAVQVPKGLFLAMTTKPEIVIQDQITLPPGSEVNAVRELTDYINSLPHSQWSFPRLGVKGMTLYGLLSIVTTATDALGLEKYVAHVYRKIEALLHNDLPTYEDLDSIIHFGKQHPRLIKIVAKNLAVRIWEGEISDIKDFNAYLMRNERLNIEIENDMFKRKAYFAHLQEIKEKEARYHHWHNKNYAHRGPRKQSPQQGPEQDPQPGPQQVADQAPQQNINSAQEMDEETKERLLWKKEKEAKEKAFWEKQKAEDAEDAKSIRHKLTLPTDKRERTFTAREKVYWRKSRGTKLPKGC